MTKGHKQTLHATALALYGPLLVKHGDKAAAARAAIAAAEVFEAEFDAHVTAIEDAEAAEQAAAEATATTGSGGE